jgi:hypothetical protein
MPAVTPDQGLSLPIGADVADNPAAFTNFVAGVEPRMVREYTNEADRTARILVLAENDISTLATENRVDIYNGAAHISLHTRSVFLTTRVAVAQVLTASSIVLQNVTNMAAALPGTVGAIFQWRSYVYYDASTAADIKFAYTIPAGASMRWGIMGLGTGGTNPSPYATTNTSGTALAVGALGLGTVHWATIVGEVTMGATAGNLQLQAAQAAADASVTQIIERSFMEVWRTA